MEDLHATEIFDIPELSKEFIDAIEYQPPHQSFRDRLLEHSFEQA